MAKCPYCNLEMDETTDTCEFDQVKVNGKWYHRKMISTANESLGTRCAGCGILIAPHHYHHCGCPHEECPNCWRSTERCECNVQALKHDDVVIEVIKLKKAIK